MRKIEAIVQSEKLDVLREAFLEAGIQRMTASEIKDYGIPKPHTEVYRSETYLIDYLARMKVEIVVPQKKVSTVISILKTMVHTGREGEDKILVSSVNDVSGISSNETRESG